MDREEKIQKIVESVGRLQRSMSAKDWHGQEFSKAQVGMLYMLYYHPATTLTELASYLGVTKSAVTQLLEPLVDKGLVSRHHSPKDRRAILLNITISGKKMVKKFNNQRMLGLRSALDHLSNKELDTLARIYQKLSITNK